MRSRWTKLRMDNELELLNNRLKKLGSKSELRRYERHGKELLVWQVGIGAIHSFLCPNWQSMYIRSLEFVVSEIGNKNLEKGQ